MIAVAVSTGLTVNSTAQEAFLHLLPRIRRDIRYAFRGLHSEARQEAVQEAIVLAFVAYVRLCQSGKEHLAFAGPLARYAVAHVRAGRKAATRLNSYDVLSTHAQRLWSLTVYHPDGRDDECAWHHILTDSRRCTPADLAASRIDFVAWLEQLPIEKRHVAETLARGETTLETARRHRVTPGRISQMRRELEHNWNQFHGL
jgi:hypothetical protein